MIKRKDLTYLNIGGEILVIATDSCGGIGLKENDVLNAPNQIVGSFTTRVVLFELLCAKAKILTIVNNICNEMNSTGIEIIEGIASELNNLNISRDIITGSTEENMPTTMTALGVVGIGKCKSLPYKPCNTGDFLLLLGEPKVGGEIDFANYSNVVSYEDLKLLLDFEGTLEASPVGSKGVAFESHLLGNINNKSVALYENLGIDFNKSGGPSTCVVALVSKDYIHQLPTTKSKLTIIGEIIWKYLFPAVAKMASQVLPRKYLSSCQKKLVYCTT